MFRTVVSTVAIGVVFLLLSQILFGQEGSSPTGSATSGSPSTTRLGNDHATQQTDHVVQQQDAVVVTVHPRATQAGLRAYRDGGNAVDAAIAAALALGVCDSHNSGLGGGCFILIRLPDNTLVAIDGRETAPAAATRDMYVRDGQVDSQLSTTGSLAIGVPGALAAYDRAMSKHGRLTLASRLRWAAKIAEAGHRIDRVMARNISNSAEAIRRFPATRKVLLKQDGQPFREGERLVQKDLAATYRQIADQGLSWFYDGPFAEAVEAWMKDHGGILTAEDFRQYESKRRRPVVSTYRGYQIIGFPPPSSGGIHVAQILNILENFDIKKLYKEDRSTFYHLIAEAMKLAFADRAYWLGDADFARVPRGLVTKAYAKRLAERIRTDQVIDVPSHGMPPDWKTDVYGKHTTHIAAADGEGYWVAITATVNTSFGSKVMIPGTGLVLNNEMDDFSAQPGVPNVFGLIGNENNAIQPYKRPLSSMSPTIVLREGQPVLTLGAAGGPKIITQVVLGLVYALDLEQPVSDWLAIPRWHHQWRPDQLMLERTFSESAAAALRARGHAIRWLESAGVTQAVICKPQGLTAAHDPRIPGMAGGLSIDDR